LDARITDIIMIEDSRLWTQASLFIAIDPENIRISGGFWIDSARIFPRADMARDKKRLKSAHFPNGQKALTR
jgi:hypothetical protein